MKTMKIYMAGLLLIDWIIQVISIYSNSQDVKA